MKTITLKLLLLSLLFGCSNSDEITTVNDPVITTPGEPLLTDMSTFIFGHSLINHQANVNPVPSNETSVPHWMYLLSQAAGYNYSASGQYGFLPQHDDLPPNPQWGFDLFPGIWDTDAGDEFGDVNFNTVLLTAGNFIQYQPATTDYYQGDSSPLSSTLTITDWVLTEEPGITIYIYENWPDMAGFISSFPPTSNEFTTYNANTVGEFHNWWIDYHNELIAARPNQSIKMIPVGPILSRLLTETPLSAIPVTELYEDDAPHGRPTIYFLAGMISYMAMYGIQTPANYQAPDIVNSIVNDNYAQTVEFIWAELQDFNDSNGNSRVW